METGKEMKLNFWVDGKQVYWKRFKGNLTGGGTQEQSVYTDFSIGYGLDEIEIIGLNGYCINGSDSSEGNLVAIPSGVHAQSWFDMVLMIVRDVKAIRVIEFGTLGNSNLAQVTINLFYTKKGDNV